MPLQHIREPKLLIKCFLNYCKHHREEVDLLFYMLSIFTVRSTIDYHFLKDFYQHEVAEKYSQQERKAIFMRFLQFFRDTSFSQDQKVQALQILIIPMLTASFNKNEYKDILDQQVTLHLFYTSLPIYNLLQPPN